VAVRAGRSNRNGVCSCDLAVVGEPPATIQALATALERVPVITAGVRRQVRADGPGLTPGGPGLALGVTA